jgi:hypothetical protein
MIVTPAYLAAREALGHSYLLRTTAFILLLTALMIIRRKRIRNKSFSKA